MSSKDSRHSSWVRNTRRKLEQTPLGVAKRRILGQPAYPPIRVEDVKGQPRPLPDFRFFAVLGTWNEEDVVEACVRNALTQGCEEVFLVDNESDDDTVGRAVGAGAVLAQRYTTAGYAEQTRIELMQDVVDSVSRDSGAEYAWWLWLDADEFAHGRSGLTLRRQLETLDRRFRIVGARWLNHYPSGTPQYRSGCHPLDYQPLAEEISSAFCQLGHRKHPLQRWDAAGPAITGGLGFHSASARVTLAEPRDPVIIHHFPFRDEAVARRRLAKLWEGHQPRASLEVPENSADAEAGVNLHASHMWVRYKSLDAVYRGDWGEVIRFQDPLEGADYAAGKGVDPRPWTEFVDPADTVIDRWY